MKFNNGYYPSLKRTPRIRTILVIGPPGSGKSTYVSTHSKSGDVIIDLDEIYCELTGKPPYSAHGQATIERAIQLRNQRIEELENKVMPGKTLWVILSAGNTIDRITWKRLLNPYRTLVMRCSKEKCIERVKQRHSEIEVEQIQAVEKWFLNFQPMTTDTFIDSGSQ